MKDERMHTGRKVSSSTSGRVFALDSALLSRVTTKHPMEKRLTWISICWHLQDSGMEDGAAQGPHGVH